LEQPQHWVGQRFWPPIILQPAPGWYDNNPQFNVIFSLWETKVKNSQGMGPRIQKLNLQNYTLTRKELLPPGVHQYFLHCLQPYDLSKVMEESNSDAPINLDDSDS